MAHTATDLAAFHAADGRVMTYRAPDMLLLFDKIRLAHMAAERALMCVHDQDRFLREYETALMWTKQTSTFVC